VKKGMTSFDCLALARELQPWLGARCDKAYQPARDEVVLRLRQHREGTREWRVKAGRWAYLSQGTRDWPEALTPFAKTLRDHLDGARLGALRQAGFDRLLELEFERADGTRHLLACELFGDGNVVLARAGNIVQSLVSLKVSHRTIAPGHPYVHPPARLDPQTATDEDLHTRLMASRADVVRTLATGWNLGGQYAEEVCARAGLDKGLKAATLDPAQRGQLAAALRALLGQVRDRPEPVLVRDGAEAVDVTPVPLATLGALSFEARGSFSEALEDYFTAYATRHEQPEDPRAAALAEERARLQRLVAAQEESLAGFASERERQRAAGDLLYANFPEVEAFLAAARERQRRLGWPMLERWPAEDLPAGFAVVRADPAEGLLTVRYRDVELPLRIDADVHANAERLYEGAKRQREKAEGARPALAERRKELEQLEREGAKLADKLAKERARRRFEPTKRMWFEAYRWFLSSEGFLVLGGRDAQGNDKLVKKHLDMNDRYVHADLQGAPSVVVKRGGGAEIGEQTLREAAEFAVAYSKAWQRRIGSAEAYWVTPEQVSKTPMPGEYLGKGSFIIRGKRSYLGVPLRAAVGLADVEGHRKVMGGPVSAVQARAARYVVLEPGTGDASELANRLSEAFEVPVEEVQAVLPPGPVSVVESEGV
jgi:predicted ribosome quality control (RQC) complex YloA/Tae2 family protein